MKIVEVELKQLTAEQLKKLLKTGQVELFPAPGEDTILMVKEITSWLSKR